MILEASKVNAVCDGQILKVNATHMCDVYVDYPIEELSTVFFKVTVDKEKPSKAVSGQELTEQEQAIISNSHTTLEITQLEREIGVITMRKTDISGNVRNEEHAT